MTFRDIFKSSFLENIGSISAFDMFLALFLAFGLGMFIFFVYKRTFSGVMYSSGFGVTLVALTMISTVVILAADYPGDHLQCGAFFGHGGRFIYRAF